MGGAGVEWPPAYGHWFSVLFPVSVKQEEKFFAERMGIGALKEVEKFKIVMVTEGVDGQVNTSK